MIELLTRTIRSYLTGSDSSYIFKPAREPSPGNLESSSLYIHIPFCRNCCPYCPYNKVDYDETLVEPYIRSLLSEMKMYEGVFGRLRITSVYIGGGTPTLLGAQLGEVLNQAKAHFDFTGDVCIEASPTDAGGQVINNLKQYGVSLVSVGVQSFNDKYLRFLGRNYSSEILKPTIEHLVDAGFSSVNVDLMFALPGQTDKELLDDLRKAVDLNVSQITTYPLFTFPYSSVGRYKKLRHIRMPNFFKRRRQYFLINDFLRSEGYNRVSVWSFKKGDIPRYSSVTRDGYIGLGAGAGSNTPNGFYLNTFSVNDYIRRCLSGSFPTALYMPFNEKMKNYFWLYWRLYDTSISNSELYRRFGKKDKKIKHAITMLKLFGLAEERDGGIGLNDSGSFWIHLLQNYFALNYINKVWTIAMRQPWPDSINL